MKSIAFGKMTLGLSSSSSLSVDGKTALLHTQHIRSPSHKHIHQLMQQQQQIRNITLAEDRKTNLRFRLLLLFFAIVIATKGKGVFLGWMNEIIFVRNLQDTHMHTHTSNRFDLIFLICLPKQCTQHSLNSPLHPWIVFCARAVLRFFYQYLLLCLREITSQHLLI